MKPNYTDLGYADCMGEKTRKIVEKQLKEDLSYYSINNRKLKYDWSDSCIEGRHAHFEDGAVENFSGIKVYDSNDNLVAEGWMDFIYEKNKDLFIVYWDFLDIFQNGQMVYIKNIPGIPLHVLEKLPEDLKNNLKDKY